MNKINKIVPDKLEFEMYGNETGIYWLYNHLERDFYKKVFKN